jgi:hypothetical protein
MREASSTWSGPEAQADPGGQVDRSDPWAFAVNSMDRHDDIDITLCSFVLAVQVVRVTGLVRFQSQPDVRLASIPTLSLARRTGVPLILASGHVLPQGAMAWVSWLYERPTDVFDEYEGRIEGLELDFLIGKRAPLARPGPWLFRFNVSPAATTTIVSRTD